METAGGFSRGWSWSGLLALVVGTAACPTGGGSPFDAAPPDACMGLCNQQVADIPVEQNRDVDILFVIDNSGSMSEEQTSLATNFPRFINILDSIEGGRPNLHIGVASSNVGISPFQTTGCVGNGDDGKLQNAPRGACTPPNGYFITDVASPDGSRITNYPSTTNLADVFSCIARLGTTGCGLEQHLESMKRALDGHRPENYNFLRGRSSGDPEALLAVILLADEDDCSAADGSVFDPSQNDISDPLGPFSSFRCTEFGLLCDGSPISRSPAGYTNCEPMPDSMADYIRHPGYYAEFLKDLKDDDGNILVAAIAGNPAPVNVILDFEGNPELDCSCGCGTPQTAAPSVRLSYLLEQFPNRNVFTSICNEDLSDALTLVANAISTMIGSRCLNGDIPDPSTCTVFDVTGGTSTEIPSCATTGGALPCHEIVEDLASCPSTDSNLALVVNRSTPAPAGTHMVVRCVVNVP